MTRANRTDRVCCLLKERRISFLLLVVPSCLRREGTRTCQGELARVKFRPDVYLTEIRVADSNRISMKHGVPSAQV